MLVYQRVLLVNMTQNPFVQHGDPHRSLFSLRHGSTASLDLAAPADDRLLSIHIFLLGLVSVGQVWSGTRKTTDWITILF